MAKEMGGAPNGLTAGGAATTTTTSTGLTTLTSATTTTTTAAANGNVMNGVVGGGPKMHQSAAVPALVGKTGKLPAPDPAAALPGGINAANERVQNYINNLEVDGRDMR